MWEPFITLCNKNLEKFNKIVDILMRLNYHTYFYLSNAWETTHTGEVISSIKGGS